MKPLPFFSHGPLAETEREFHARTIRSRPVTLGARLCFCEWCSRELRGDQVSLIVNPNVQK